MDELAGYAEVAGLDSSPYINLISDLLWAEPEQWIAVWRLTRRLVSRSSAEVAAPDKPTQEINEGSENREAVSHRKRRTFDPQYWFLAWRRDGKGDGWQLWTLFHGKHRCRANVKIPSGEASRFGFALLNGAGRLSKTDAERVFPGQWESVPDYRKRFVKPFVDYLVSKSYTVSGNRILPWNGKLDAWVLRTGIGCTQLDERNNTVIKSLSELKKDDLLDLQADLQAGIDGKCHPAQSRRMA
jgi:hypothetical protein